MQMGKNLAATFSKLIKWVRSYIIIIIIIIIIINLYFMLVCT